MQNNTDGGTASNRIEPHERNVAVVVVVVPVGHRRMIAI